MPKPDRLLLAFALAALCLSAQAQVSSIASTEDFLVASSARDFSSHDDLRHANVRDVRLKHAEDGNGGEIYMLCGQLQSGEQVGTRTWTDFATVKTEDYEQWIGGAAFALCQNASPVPGASDDLSASLQVRMGNAQEQTQ